MAANTWLLRRQQGQVAEERVSNEPAAMSRRIKDYARQYGAELVGITAIPDEALYEGQDVPYKYAICLGMQMNREEMKHVPQQRAAVEVMRTYKEISRVAVRLGENIRSLGWPAKAYGNPNSTEILHISLAISAGLGQLGKHGSMISKEYGSNFRLADVLTDLPLQPDEPVDFGVEDLCLNCRRCVIDCPPSAIFEEKQTVREQMVCRLRSMRALLRQDARLRNLHRGLSLERARTGSASSRQASDQTRLERLEWADLDVPPTP